MLGRERAGGDWVNTSSTSPVRNIVSEVGNRQESPFDSPKKLSSPICILLLTILNKFIGFYAKYPDRNINLVGYPGDFLCLLCPYPASCDVLKFLLTNKICEFRESRFPLHSLLPWLLSVLPTEVHNPSPLNACQCAIAPGTTRGPAYRFSSYVSRLHRFYNAALSASQMELGPVDRDNPPHHWHFQMQAGLRQQPSSDVRLEALLHLPCVFFFLLGLPLGGRVDGGSQGCKLSREERLESLEDPESRSRVGFPEIDPGG